ncbi:hypothetical protein [Desulforamulus aquiferis]|uniref:Uncharacterized protein n=1 Tax=Desulforamulus aquiferis TaxID=1397668 RepID=A0AAW7ZCP8_9FIRM|nr:hypothetical protein [Desulforamulus aquiferis]MDO7787106.1 hypothetical protein [Desulforamulus aquiferis]
MIVLDIALVKALVFLLLLIVVNVILGCCIALRKGELALNDLPRFLRTEVLPYYVGILALACMAMIEDVQAYGTQPLAWAAIVAYGTRTVFVEIKGKVFVLFGVPPNN